MSTGKKIGLAIACVAAAFVVAAVFIAPRLVELDLYRPVVVSYVEQQTGRRVEIGHLALGILPDVAIRVDHFAIGNAPGFPSGNWLAVERIDARLDFGALLHRQIVIRALKLEHPVLDLLSDRQGHWNFQVSPPPGSIRLPPNDPPPFVIQEIVRLTLGQGEVSARELQPNGQPGPSVCDARGLSLVLGQIDTAELNAMSRAASAAPMTSGSPNSGAAPSSPSTTGELSLTSLRFSNLQATRVETNVQVSPAQIRLDGLHFGFYGGRGQGTVTLDLASAAVRYQAQTQVTGLDVAQFLAEFPSARGQMTGTLDAKATFSGAQTPSSHMWEDQQGKGVLTIRKGAWPKIKWDPSLLQLVKLAQLGPTSGNLSAFSSISADWRLAGGVITTSKIRILGEGATVDGSGTVDLSRDDRLDFQGVINIAAHRNLLSNFLASISGATFRAGRINVPFVVSGTVKKPVFGLKTSPQFGQPAPASGM